MMIKRLALVVLTVIMVGCTATPTIVNDEVFFTSKIVDNLPRGVHGRSTCYSHNVCVIEIARETYPSCVGHEVVHGHSGDWHEGYETTWGCEGWQ